MASMDTFICLAMAIMAISSPAQGAANQTAVSCGNHKAANCSNCVGPGQGAGHCNGECTWMNGECTRTDLLEKMLNPVVLLTGGKVEGRPDWRSVEVFHPWGYCNEDLLDLPDSRKHHTINLFKGDVILCGSILQYKEDPSPPTSCLSFDGKQQRFVHHSNLTYSNSFHTGTVVDDRLLLLQRPSENTQMRSQSWNGSQWSYPYSREEAEKNHFSSVETQFAYSSCSAKIGEDALLVTGLSNSLFKYEGGKWGQMEDIPGTRDSGFFGCAVIQTPEGDAFLIAGGLRAKHQYLDEYLDSSYLYKIQKNKWEEVGKLSVPRKNGKLLVANGTVFMVGGITVQGLQELTVEKYNMETKNWTTIEQKIKRPRYGFGAIVVPGALVGCSTEPMMTQSQINETQSQIMTPLTVSSSSTPLLSSLVLSFALREILW